MNKATMMLYYDGFETNVDVETLADELEAVSDAVWNSDHEHSIVASILLMMARDAALLLTDCDVPYFWDNLSSHLRHIAGYASGLDGLDDDARMTMTAICAAERSDLPLARTLH